MGWKFQENQNVFAWYGQYVGDYRKYEKQITDLGISTSEYGKCTHAIQVPGAKYEIGLVRKGNRFVPLWDTWPAGGLQDITEASGMGGFLAAYAIEKTKLEARRKGYQVSEQKLPNGSTRLVVQVP